MSSGIARYGSIEWLEQLRVSVANASQADTGAIRNRLMMLSESVTRTYGDILKHDGAKPKTYKFPMGCPKMLMWREKRFPNPSHYGTENDNPLHEYIQGHCEHWECIPVELHSYGTRDRLSRAKEAQ